MSRYRFHWKDGKINEGEGNDSAEALTKLGYSQGAVAALDYWELVAPLATPSPDKEG